MCSRIFVFAKTNSENALKFLKSQSAGLFVVILVLDFGSNLLVKCEYKKRFLF